MREELKKARRDAGLTQEQVAEKLKVGLRQYQRIEAGSSNGSIDHWDALEDLLGVHQRTLRLMRDNHPDTKESQ